MPEPVRATGDTIYERSGACRCRPLARLAAVAGLVAAAALAVGAAPGAGAAASEKRKALVVGNARYVDAAPLRNSARDAAAFADKLRGLGFEVALGLDLDKAAFERAVNAFAGSLDGAATALFYYAGHGLQVDGRNFIVPVDARASNEADLPFELVALDVVLNRLAGNRVTSIVVLDACRDNPLGERLSKALGERRTAVGRGLASVTANVGTLISFSTQPGNAALDGDGDHSPFTRSLLAHVETPDVDVLDLMKRVRRDVVTATAREQVPWDNSSLIDAFYFRRSAAVEVPPRKAPRLPPADAGPGAGRDRDLELVLPPANGAGDGREATGGRPPVHDCDRLAASATDPERVVAGNSIGDLDGPAGIRACRAALARYPHTPRFAFQLARSLHKAAAYDEAARLYHGLVERGYLAAFTNYGWLLDNGAGVARDHRAAVRLHLLAAHQGDQFGMFNAAMSYDSGNGLPYNPAQAAHWIYAAVRLGHDYSIRRMRTDAAGWTKAFRIEMQRLLRRAGLYDGPLDGVFGPEVHRAVERLHQLPLAPTPGGTRPAQRFDPRSIPINAPAR